MGYTVRLPAYRILQDKIGYFAQTSNRATTAKRHAPLVRQLRLSGVLSWNKSRHVVVKVEWHPGKVISAGRLHRHQPERIVAFYNQRGT